MNNLYAHTATEQQFPEYVSLNVRDDGACELTVRSPSIDGVHCGTAGAIVLNEAQRNALAVALLRCTAP